MVTYWVFFWQIWTKFAYYIIYRYWDGTCIGNKFCMENKDPAYEITRLGDCVTIAKPPAKFQRNQKRQHTEIPISPLRDFVTLDLSIWSIGETSGPVPIWRRSFQIWGFSYKYRSIVRPSYFTVDNPIIVRRHLHVATSQECTRNIFFALRILTSQFDNHGVHVPLSSMISF